MSLHLQLVLARSSGFDFIEVIDEGRGNKNDKKHHLPGDSIWPFDPLFLVGGFNRPKKY